MIVATRRRYRTTLRASSQRARRLLARLVAVFAAVRDLDATMRFGPECELPAKRKALEDLYAKTSTGRTTP